MSFKDYLRVQRSNIGTSSKFYKLGSKKQQIMSLEIRKKALTSGTLDDKRVQLACGVQTLPYGHYSLHQV